MGRNQRFILAFGLILLAATFSSCGTKVVGLNHDPTFTYAAMNGGGLAVGGVVHPLGYGERYLNPNEMADHMRLQIMRQREDVRVRPVGVVRTAMGEGFYLDMMRDFEMGATMDEAHLMAMREVVSEEVRYVMFCRVEDDVIRQYQKHTTQGKDEEKKDVLEMRTSRTMTAEFRVYDVDQGYWVWQGHLTKRRVNKNRYVQEQYQNEDELLEIVVGVILDEIAEKPVYPRPPNSKSMLTPMFRNFAKKLPEPGKRYTAQN